jgi:peptide chain release factor 1
MNTQVADKLRALETRYEQLMQLVSDSSVQADPPTYRTHTKALFEIQPLVEKSRAYRALEQELRDVREMAAGGDRDLQAMAEEEAARIEPLLATLAEEIRILLIPRDPNDDRNIVLEIRGGTGGDEAALFAADLFRMYSRYAERKGWRVDVMSMNETGVGGLKEVVATIEGKGVFGRLRYESGVHRVQRVPTTEASGRIHTSTATVAVLPEAEEVDVEIKDQDLRIDTFCASGPGGQSVNTTKSAVRITHVPTGLVVSQQDEKSQIKNKAKAMKVLRSRLYEMEMRKQQDAIAQERRGQVGTGERSEKIRTYNFKENRVTDHRVNFTMHQLSDALDGSIDELIDQMAVAAQEERLRAATETDAAVPAE